jgi:microcystin-dependent protein
MAYAPREIKDRVAVGDDIFIVEDLGNNRIRLIPAPTHVSEPGTPVNKALLQHMENHLVPPGAIIMWSGSVNDIPVGWALCDGSNGTPDLRDRFIVGAGGAYSPGNTGGAESVTLTVAQMPQHNHSASSSSTGAHTHSISTSSAGSHSHSASSGSAGAHTHDISTNSAGSHTHGAGTYQTDTYTPPEGDYANYFSRYNGLDLGNDALVGDFSTRTQIRVQHSHKVTGTSGSAGSHSHSGTAASAGSHSHSITVNNTGSSQPHENRPPYYALCFIMKL